MNLRMWIAIVGLLALCTLSNKAQTGIIKQSPPEIVKRSLPEQLTHEEKDRLMDTTGLVQVVLLKDGASQGQVRLEIQIVRLDIRDGVRRTLPIIRGGDVKVRVLSESGREISVSTKPKDADSLVGLGNGGAVSSMADFQIPGTGEDVYRIEVDYAGTNHSFKMEPPAVAR